MYSDKVKINEKPSRMRVRHGDVIVRSEYNDGVLRDNSRANNRLSSQMKMFDKAQRVIMKDLMKETQFIRTKNGIGNRSPRQEKYSPSGLFGNKSPQKKTTQPAKQSKAKTQNIQSPKETNSFVFNSLSDKNNNKHFQNIGQGRVGRVRPILSKSENSLDNGHDIDKESLKLSLADLGTSSSVSVSSPSERRNGSSRYTFTHFHDRKTESVISDSHRSNQMSAATTIGRKGGIQNFVDRQVSATSRLSFIEILQKAEEAKQKGIPIEEHVPRPKTPELLSDFGSDESEKDIKRKSTHVGATPKSTFISHHV